MRPNSLCPRLATCVLLAACCGGCVEMLRLRLRLVTSQGSPTPPIPEMRFLVSHWHCRLARSSRRGQKTSAPLALVPRCRCEISAECSRQSAAAISAGDRSAGLISGAEAVRPPHAIDATARHKSNGRRPAKTTNRRHHGHVADADDRGRRARVCKTNETEDGVVVRGHSL